MYEPTLWKDHVVAHPRTYNFTNNEDGTKTLNPAPGEVIQQGTPLNAFNLNKIEQGIVMLNNLLKGVREVITAISTNGVKAFGTNLEVVPNDGDFSIIVLPGAAVIQGYSHSAETQTVLTIEAAEAEPRIDRVVLRLHLDTDPVTFSMEVLKGQASVLPEAPQIVRNGEVYDISLAQVVVPADATGVFIEQISDDRNNEAVCGAITPHALTMSVLSDMLAEAVGQTLGPDSIPTFAGMFLNGPLDMQGNPISNAIFE